MIRSKAILKSAQGENCTVHSPPCNNDTTTTIWAHSNLQIHGKGKGIKAHDIFGCYACYHCHIWLDTGDAPRDVKVLYFYNAMSRTWLKLIEKGLMEIKLQ